MVVMGHVFVTPDMQSGFAYFGVNSDKVENLNNLTWRAFLTDPTNVRIEDVKVPLQAYP